MPVKCQTIVSYVEELAPKALALEHDNSGWQVGDPQAPVEKVLVALDVSGRTVDEAAAKGAGLIVSHHPLIYRPLRNIRFDLPLGGVLTKIIRAGIGVYSAHTNLDAAEEGVNAALAAQLGLTDITLLHPDAGGFGRVGRPPAPVVFGDYVEQVKKALNVPSLRIGGPPDRVVEKVALCGGSGSDLWPKAAFTGADVFITGDLKYHTAQDILNAGMNFIDPGHFGSEIVVLEPLALYLRERLAKAGLKVAVEVSRSDSDPFVFR